MPNVKPNPHRKSPKGKPRGFTLIELLVVIAIISLLVSILLPSLTKAKDLARAVACLSNQKNIGSVLYTYANDYDGYIPAPYTPSPYSDQLGYWDRIWHTRLSHYDYIPAILRADDYFILSDMLRCPGTEQKTESQLVAEFGANGKWIWEIQAYGMRVYALEPDSSDLSNDKPLSRIRQPSEFFLVADSWMWQYGTMGYQISYNDVGRNWRAHTAHMDKANALMSDGHAEPVSADYFDDQYMNHLNKSGLYSVWPE